MTAKEIQNLREGDVIFDIEKSEGYHISKVHEGYVEYTDGMGAGSIPTKHLLHWNYISLMREREENWSEEDKCILGDAVTAVDLLGNDDEYSKTHPNLAKAFRVAKDWLKCLPERFNLQPKQEWGEESRRRLDRIQMVLESWDRSHTSLAGLPSTIPDDINWLKSLRPS